MVFRRSALHSLIWLAGSALVSGAVFAAQEPANIPLNEAKKALKGSQSRIEQIQKDAATLESELSGIRQKLVEVTAALRKQEAILMDLESKESTLSTRKKKAEKTLQAKRDEISHLLQSLIRLSRTPPEAVIAMPGELRDTLQAAGILSQMTESIRRKTLELDALLVQLERDSLQLAETKETLEQEIAKIELARTALDKQLKTRRRIQKQLNREQSEENEKLASLSQKVSSLQELLTKIEEERAKLPLHAKLSVFPKPKPAIPSYASNWSVASTRQVATAKPAQTKPSRSFKQAKGRLKLPVIGTIQNRFGEKIRKNETHKGLTIASRQGAEVISPLEGKVIFTGPFLEYGKMVILRYDNGYHLLLAGLGEINCTAGQEISAGEPVGRMGHSATGNRSSLYLELRQGSKAIDPAPWFG